ncbi:MAG: FG-GAP-like repeat-containing protein [Pyrinomonadaceae bacterium]|nr:FG-GAP-like repeat-containing protein [Pyrinomonadaceae bacterium]MCX7639628.1 FG-GAP-like repeat-containing protein [Pyrinomonadaceae bacterium]MDW8303354.1 FG-GAP-like repeat-containing protein [Acidobacteriota bacterium]
MKVRKKVKLLLFFFAIAIVTLSAQSLDQDLQKSFRTYSIQKLSEDELLLFVEYRYFNLKTKDGQIIATINPKDLRSRKYIAQATTKNGVVQLEPNFAVKTFSGKIQGQPNSEVRLTIDIDKQQVEGYFWTENGNIFFIEPASRYSEKADKNEFVIYRKEDILNTELINCLADRIEKTKSVFSQNDYIDHSSSFTSYRVFEVATEADFEYVNSFGGASQANSEILSILNMVDGVYRRELGLTLEVVFQNAWTTPDPYDGSTANNLLVSFRNYWNANRTSVSRDVAHLWTNKSFTDAAGIAYVGVVCAFPTFSYGLSKRLNSTPGKFILTAHEIGHNFNATHLEAPQGCANTIMNATLTFSTQLTFCQGSRTEISNFVSSNNSCMTFRILNFDFDGDELADLAVFRPSNGTWFILNSSNNSLSTVQFGLSSDKLAPADYDGDAKTDIAVFRNGTWYILKSSNSSFEAVNFGISEDLPMPADYDGDRKADISVFRPSSGTWYRLNSSNGGFSVTQFGTNGDIPLAADYDGDGRADITVFRPSIGTWFRLNSSNNSFFALQFGSSGDKPVIGDFNSDGRADLAVFRPSNGFWYILMSGSNSLYAAQFGISTDLPAPADFNGDGRAELCVFRNGTWHVFNISNGLYSSVQFGLATDKPAQGFYVP